MPELGSLYSANQFPEKTNFISQSLRNLFSYAPKLRIMSGPARPQGISVYMRVKDECDWIAASVESIGGIADEIIVIDNGSMDGTYEILQKLARSGQVRIKLWQRPDLNHCDLSNFALEKTSFRWAFRWDGDMIAQTSGVHAIGKLRDRLLALDPNRFYVIYLRHINLSGDLFHQDPKEMVHIEEYLHSCAPSARFIHPGRFEAVRFPLYFRPLFWYEPYAFHVNVKSARRMLFRHFWEDWMALKDYVRYPGLESYVSSQIEKEFGTARIEEAETIYLMQALRDHIPFDPERFGPYPDLLKPFLKKPRYRIEYQGGKISGRKENDAGATRHG